MTVATTVLLDPTGTVQLQEHGLTPRRHTTLDGLTVGLVGNSKLNADEILIAVGDLLKERYKIKAIVHDRKQNFSHPAPDEVVDRVIKEADVVIAGVGD
jgi:hypothetical protein